MEEHVSSSPGPRASNAISRNPGTIDIDLSSQHFERYSKQSLYSDYSQSSQTTQGSQDRRLRKSGTGGGAWNAPVAHFMMTETSGQTYGFGTKTEEDRYCRLAEEARRWVLGPMPPREFLNEFLDQDDEWACRREMPTSKGAFDAVPKGARLEKSIYEPLARAMNQGRCPGFTFCITSEAADDSGPLGLTGSSKPALCCYAYEHFDKVKNYEPKSKKKNDAGDQVPDDDMGGAGGSSDEGADSESEGLSDAATARGTSPTSAVIRSNTKPISRLEHVPMKHTHMGYAALVVEVKASPHDDVFRDPKPKDNQATFHFVTQSTNTKVIRRLGQQVSYASEICKRQHRHFCFTISICSHYARFIRWDRAGAVVSERFSVREQPELLCDFLWRFAWASHAQRGYDLTVEPATPDQAKGFELAIRAHVRSQGGPTAPPKFEDAVKEHFQQESVTVIHLPGSSSPGPQPEPDELAGHYLLVSRPIVIPLSVAGRGTRVYWAVDPLTKNVCLLKDTWRYDAPREPDEAETEGDVLHALCAVTENVPRVIRHGDVLRSTVVVMDDLTSEEANPLMIQHTDGDVQTTLTQNFLQHSWVCHAGRTPDQLKRFIIKRTHYRLVLGVAGYPLLRFKDSNELRATHDAFGALIAAFEQGKRLHRDITPGNIILYSDPARCIERSMPRKGYLIDWELSHKCKPKDSKSYVSDESCPVSATWQFVSAAIAKYVRKDGAPRQRHTIGDDIESIIYVVLYCALLWLPFKKPDPWAVKNVLEMFDYCTPWQDGVIRGGLLKDTNLEDQSYTRPLQWTVPIIQQWLSEALDWVARDARQTSRSKMRVIAKAFHAWWGEFLVNKQGHNPAKRSDNTKVKVLRHVFTSKKSAAVMEGVIHQSTISASGNSSNRVVGKRVRGGDSAPSSPHGDAGSSSKRPRLSRGDVVTAGGRHLLPTAGAWRTANKESIDTIQAASSWNSSRASSVLRELLNTEGGVEGDLDHPDAYDSDPTSGAEEEPTAGEREGEDEVTGEIEVSVAKGKGHARGVRGWGQVGSI